MKLENKLWKDVKVTGGFWADKQKMIADKTLEHIYQKYVEKGRIGATTWQKGDPDKPHYYYDSDVAKLIEAAAYSMIEFPDADIKAKMEEVIDNFLAIQEDDGYMNSYFHNVAPEEKWTDLRIKHELYCAGHLFEAAVAWKQATNDDKLLNAMCRYADLIYSKFGREEGKIFSFPGHQEIELALIKLYNITGNEKYLELSEFFVVERGTDNSYWDKEILKSGASVDTNESRYLYFQAHLPAVEQETAEGHAVRACYFYSAMADVARETNNHELYGSCKKLWENIVKRRMNVTGGIGSNNLGEMFTYDYDFPESYYYETCAQISLFFFAWRMFLNEQKAEYTDIMELTMFNSILSGIDIAGKGFFYVNPLSSNVRESKFQSQLRQACPTERVEDFNCSCCPPNVSRFIASISQYVFANKADSVWVNLFMSAETVVEIENKKLGLTMTTDYPWDEQINLDISTEKALSCKILIRIPVWARSFELKINGADANYEMQDGYAMLEREWLDGDKIELSLPMPVEILEAHPKVRQAAGKVALKRGPVVYCLEGIDNDSEVFNIKMPEYAKFELKNISIGDNEIPAIEFDALKRIEQDNEDIYHPVNSEYSKCKAVAIPYHLWANRGENDMTVWIGR